MKQSTFTRFMKEWGFFLLFLILFLLSRLFLWTPVTVEGHSMDPTLADGEQLIAVRYLSVDRFDIVVARETADDGTTKDIVKRVIGLPGDTIKYENDQLYINGEQTNEPYLTDYIQKFKDDKLQSTYSYNSFFQQLAEQASAFTIDSQGSASFTIEVPEGQYLLLGDDRIVSKDSREVGTFSASSITGEVKFRYWPLWPLDRFGIVN